MSNNRTYSKPLVIATEKKRYVEAGDISMQDLSSSLKEELDRGQDISNLASIDEVRKLSAEIKVFDDRMLRAEQSILLPAFGSYKYGEAFVFPEAYVSQSRAICDSPLNGTVTAYTIVDGVYVGEAVTASTERLAGQNFVNFGEHTTDFDNTTFFWSNDHYVIANITAFTGNYDVGGPELFSHTTGGSVVLAPGFEGVLDLVFRSQQAKYDDNHENFSFCIGSNCNTDGLIVHDIIGPKSWVPSGGGLRLAKYLKGYSFYFKNPTDRIIRFDYTAMVTCNYEYGTVPNPLESVCRPSQFEEEHIVVAQDDVFIGHSKPKL